MAPSLIGSKSEGMGGYLDMLRVRKDIRVAN
jgi:hypothetical protein